MTVTIIAIFALLCYFILPSYLMKGSRALKVDKFLSDIMICYGIGMLIGNSKSLWLYSWASSPELEQFTADISAKTTEMAEVAAFASVLLAIPMLLMLNNVGAWLKYTGKITMIFLLGVVTVLLVTIGMGYWFGDTVESHEITSGMLAGVYIGGTPNMVAVSKALNADNQLFIILNATDTLCSGLYFFFLLSLAKPVYGLLLPKFKPKKAEEGEEAEQIAEPVTDMSPFPPKRWSWARLQPLLIATTLAIGALLLALGPAMLIKDAAGGINQTILMLLLSTIGIVLSFDKSVRQLKGVYNYAQYLLLIFGLAAGYMADFGNLILEGGNYLQFNIIVIVTILVIHFLLAVILRVDVDTFMLSSTASIMGPPFVPQVAAVLKNEKLLPVAIALSLLGLSLANYAGILVSYVLSFFG